MGGKCVNKMAMVVRTEGEGRKSLSKRNIGASRNGKEGSFGEE